MDCPVLSVAYLCLICLPQTLSLVQIQVWASPNLIVGWSPLFLFCVFLCVLVQFWSGQSDFCSAFLSVSIVSMLFMIISGVLGLLAFIGLYLDLFNHLILPGALFLGLFCIMGGAENWNVLALLHGSTLSLLLSPWKPDSYVSERGKVSPFYSME